MKPHDWKPDFDVLNRCPVLVCAKCDQVWRPNQFTPKNACGGKKKRACERQAS